MATDKSKLAKLNLKTSLYFAGSITFGTVAVGTGISIPIYLEIKKSLEKAIEQFSNLSKYFSQLAQKLGIPGDSEFEQELANGYVAIHTGEGTQVFKEVNGQKVLVMNSKPDGTVQTAASFEGVEALTMITAIQSAKEAFDSESQAMDAIFAEYGNAISDSSYLTESATTKKSVALLVLRDKLADVVDVAKLTDAQKNDIVKEANDQSDGISLRNKNPKSAVTVKDIPDALLLKDKQLELAELDQAKADNTLKPDQAARLEEFKKNQADAVEAAKNDIEKIKQNQIEVVAKAAQEVATKTQAQVVKKIEENPNVNTGFIAANTSTFERWFPLLGATFGNNAGNGLIIHTPSIRLRKAIKNQLEKNEFNGNIFDHIENSLLEIIGLVGEDFLNTGKIPNKKILTVTEIFSSFSYTDVNKYRKIIYDIKVNNITTSKIEDYFLIAEPFDTEIKHGFKEFKLISEDMDALSGNKNDFDLLIDTLTQLSLIYASKYLQSISTPVSVGNGTKLVNAALVKINEIYDNLESSKAQGIKFVINDSVKSKLEDFVKKYAVDPSTSGIYQDFALMLFDSNFNIGGKDIDFDPKYLDELIKLLIEKDGYIPSSNAKPEEIYLGYESQKLLGYIKNNFETFGNYDSVDKENILDVFKNNWASFDAIGISNKIKNSNPELMFDKDVVKLIPSNDAKELADLKDVIGTFSKEIVELLKKNPTDLKPYIRNMKFIKSLQLSDPQIDMFRDSLLDDKLLPKFDELYSIANNTNTIPSTQATYKDGTADYIKNETVALVAQLKANAQLQTIIKHYNWVKTLGLDDTQYGKLKLPLFDVNLFAKFDALISVSDTTGNIPNTNISYKGGTIDYIKNEIDAFVGQLNVNTSAQIQTIIEHYNWIKSLTLDEVQYGKLKLSLFDTKQFVKYDELISVSNTSGSIPGTKISYKDGTVQFIKENIDALVVQLSRPNSKLQTFVENYIWAKDALALDGKTLTTINKLLIDDKYFGTWASIIALSNDANWKPQDGNGQVGKQIDAIKQYFTKETQTLINQFDSNADIVAIKESMRYTFKGVSVSDPKTQTRIDAAKDVAKDLDNISGLDDASKTSIQSSVENVITSQDTQALTGDEFNTIMKYTQTVFKLFTTHADAVKQLNKVLDPKRLVANNHEIVKNIEKLNTWVDAIEAKNPGTTITLDMIRSYAWQLGVISTKYVNGDPNVDIANEQTSTAFDRHLLSGAQLTSNGKVMTIGSYMWGLWELEHVAGSNETKISPVGASQLTQLHGSWASAPYYNGQDMYAIPLVINSSNAIYKYDATGKETKISVNVTNNTVELRTAVVLDVGSKKIAYGLSSSGAVDEFDITDTSKPATQTHVEYSTVPSLTGWSPTWTAGALKIGNENYIAIPMTNTQNEFGLAMWHAESNGHLKFVNLAKFSVGINKIIFDSTHEPDPTDATKVVAKNSGIWSNALTSGETSGLNASLFMLIGDGKLLNIQFDEHNNVNDNFVINETKTAQIIDAAAILPQIDSNSKQINNAWRGMTYNPATHEINIFGKTGAVYVPDQQSNIEDIYNTLLT